MYASKLLTERSPVAKCVMIAEANMDAADSFCAVPDGTGYRDMARSESSAWELGRPAAAKAGAGVGGGRSSGEAGNDRGAKGSCIESASNRSAGATFAMGTLDVPDGTTLAIEYDGDVDGAGVRGVAQLDDETLSRIRLNGKRAVQSRDGYLHRRGFVVLIK